MTPLSLPAHHAAPASAIGPAVLIVVLIVAAWRFAIFRNGKGTPSGRVLAVLLAAGVFWVLLAVTRPAAAGTVATGAAAGFATLLGAAARMLGSA